MSKIGFNATTPVLMSSSCTVARNNTGLPKALDLTYPFRKALWIEEIRFTIVRATQGGIPADRNGAQSLGALVAMTLQMGRHYIARYPTPIWILGTAQDRYQEQSTDVALSTTEYLSQYRWRLPSPLYLEPGQTLLPVFQRGLPAGLPDDAYDQNFTVYVTYAGRTVDPSQPKPRSIQVPYVAPFLTNNASTYQQSNEYDLLNMFDKPVRVQRMTGRVYTFLTTTRALETQALTPRPADIASNLYVKIEDSWGGKMVNDPTGPSDVWDIIRGAWTIDTVMPPKGQYLVKVSNLNTAAGQYLHVALIGERQEAI